MPPNYKKIYGDLLEIKYPHKKEACADILAKPTLSAIDILLLNRMIFNTEENEKKTKNQKLHSYDRASIYQILDFQKKNDLNNSELARHFKMSRNTIAKWKKNFSNMY